MLHRIIICVFFIANVAVAWKEWKYFTQWYVKSTVQPDIDEEIASKQVQWYSVWSNQTLEGATQNSPRPRRGHSMVIARTVPGVAPFFGHSYILLFGGRDNQNVTSHTPKTYNIIKENGTVQFTTYEDKPVDPCAAGAENFYTAKQREACDPNVDVSRITIGKFYNDVWAYRICNETQHERVFDYPCTNSGWMLLHPGAAEGGCTIQLGILVCTVPSERYLHGSVMFDDLTMYVYGGFSERCVDFCDDIWFYDIYVGGWREVYATGALSRLYYEVRGITNVYYSVNDVPIDNSSSAWAGPGKRWRHSTVLSDPYYSASGEYVQDMVVFGGHRLWHGYALENSQTNNWDNHTTYPEGGYLDDLWIYTKILDTTTTSGETLKSSLGSWKIKKGQTICVPDFGVFWNERNQTRCFIPWPSERGGHGSAYDNKRHRVWIYGGYHTYFPYLLGNSPGSGFGLLTVLGDANLPYPGFDYFLGDLWYYDLNEEQWYEVKPPPKDSFPMPRSDMVFLLTGDVIFMHGGFRDSNYLDDTWYFNISTGRWLEKKTFTYPDYPADCTDDWLDMNITYQYGREQMYNPTNTCFSLLWPLHLKRSTTGQFEIEDYSKQPYYYPDPDYGPYDPPNPYHNINISNPYYNIFPKNFDSSGVEVTKTDIASIGTPIFPFAATGPIQYVKPFIVHMNGSAYTLLERCTSVYAEPTRGRLLDAEPRRQRPGWDGCRDRSDGRSDLPNELQYVKPLARAQHRAVYFAETSEIFMFGGNVISSEEPYSVGITHGVLSKDDMWYYNLNHCISNCSLHGVCSYGFCYCDVGYYGIDCSNTSCPGTFCMYDEHSQDQKCKHACHAGYNHTDYDIYSPDTYKLPCAFAEIDPTQDPGEINGICDGYGTAYCAPPFVGDDCSIKDCASNCSFNGWCSIEFPVSRCMCNPGYFGEICDKKQCLNNCSYPNGVCNTTSGDCICNMLYSPYLNTRPHKPWDGLDCSYLFPYEGADAVRVWSYSVLALVLVSIVFVNMI